MIWRAGRNPANHHRLDHQDLSRTGSQQTLCRRNTIDVLIGGNGCAHGRAHLPQRLNIPAGHRLLNEFDVIRFQGLNRTNGLFHTPRAIGVEAQFQPIPDSIPDCRDALTFRLHTRRHTDFQLDAWEARRPCLRRRIGR